jgi:hypothetical protein
VLARVGRLADPPSRRQRSQTRRRRKSSGDAESPRSTTHLRPRPVRSSPRTTNPAETKWSPRSLPSCHRPLRSRQEAPPSSRNSSDTAARGDRCRTSARQPVPESRMPKPTRTCGQPAKLTQAPASARTCAARSKPASLSEGLRSSCSVDAAGMSVRFHPFRDQTRLKISVPLVPPNPNEFDRAERSGMRRAALGT